MSTKPVDSVESFLTHVARRAKAGNTTWYRGQLDKHGLKPSLFRHRDINSFTDAIRKEFALRADFADLAGMHYEHKIETGLHGLMQMQHYRIPTRLLDWTRNPLTGLFFALSECQATDNSEDAAVWLLDPDEWNSRALKRLGGKSRPLGLDDSEIRSYVGADERIVLSGENPVTIRGHVNSTRIAAQQGAFVLLGNSPVTLESMDDAAQRLRISKDILLKLTIPKDKAGAMLDNLLAMGITDDFIYPDLEGVVSHIRRKAGFPR